MSPTPHKSYWVATHLSLLNPESSCLPELVAEGKWDSTFVVTPIIHVGGRVWPHYCWTHKHIIIDHSDLWSQVVKKIVITFCDKVLYLVDIDWTLISWNKKVLSISVVYSFRLSSTLLPVCSNNFGETRATGCPPKVLHLAVLPAVGRQDLLPGCCIDSEETIANI